MAAACGSSSSSSSSKSHPSDNLKYLWMLKSVQFDVGGGDKIHKRKEYLIGGALCVHSDGIIIAVTHGIKPDCPEYDDPLPVITARNYGCQEWRATEWIKGISFESSGICFLRLVKEEQVEDESFAFWTIPPSVSIDLQTKVHAFVYDDGVPFSLVFATTSYPFSGNLTLTQHDDDESVVNLTFTSKDKLQPRTLASIIDIKGNNNICAVRKSVSSFRDRRIYLKNALSTSLQKLTSTLPLVQVSGFNENTLDGQCGWPVFKDENNELVGLIGFSTGFYQFVIPVQVLYQALDKNLSFILQCLRRSGSGNKRKEVIVPELGPHEVQRSKQSNSPRGKKKKKKTASLV